MRWSSINDYTGLLTFYDVVQLFSLESGPVDSRPKILSQSAPFVIKNDTDIRLIITFGEYFQVTVPGLSLTQADSASSPQWDEK